MVKSLVVALQDDNESVGKKDVGNASNSLSNSTSVQSSLYARFVVCRRVAIFVEGMTRGIILPFGPYWVHLILFEKESNKAAAHSFHWTSSKIVVFYGSALFVVSALGKWFGELLADRFSSTIHGFDYEHRKLHAPSLQQLKQRTQQLSRVSARLGAASISLNLYASLFCTSPSGLSSSIGFFLLLRFASTTFAAWLTELLRCVNFPEDHSYDIATSLDDIRKSHGLTTSPSVARLYLQGFAFSVLCTGLLLYLHTAIEEETSTISNTDSNDIYHAFTYAALSALAVLYITMDKFFRYYLLRTWSKIDQQPKDYEYAQDIFLQSDCSPKKRSFSSDARSRALSLDLESQAFLDPVNDDFELFVDFQNIQSSSSRMMSLVTLDDEFFDCHSVLSDVELCSLHGYDTEVTDENDRRVAQYINKCVVYGDGVTPAYVPHGETPDHIPASYLQFFNGNQQRAQRAWETSQRWRLEQNVWKTHRLPNRWFSKIKQAYPHFLHGYSKQGYPVIYEQPGQMNLKELFRNGCDVADMVRHYIFFMEFISNCICSRPEIRMCKGDDAPAHDASSWGILVVMDVKGAGLTSLSGDVVKYLKQAGEINSAHYPLSLKRAFLVNSPFWLSGAWSGIKGILPDSVQVDILSESTYLDDLRQYIDEDQLPPEYSGKSPYQLGSHPYELELKQLVLEAEREQEFDSEKRSESDAKKEVIPEKTHDEKKTEISNLTDVIKEVPSRNESLIHRRRLGSVDRRLRWSSSATGGPRDRSDSFVSETDHFLVISFLLSLWNAFQGALEVFIPFWLMSPTENGGLGVSVWRCGISVICAALAVLWALRTSRLAKLITRLPGHFPITALRVGAGSQSILLCVLVIISSSTLPQKRSDSVLVMASTITICGTLTCSAMLGKAGLSVLHRIASDDYARRHNPPQNIFVNIYGKQGLASACASGRFTGTLEKVSEIVGIIALAPLLMWSFTNELPAPFDATMFLFVSASFAFFVYVHSFSIHFSNNSGEFLPRLPSCDTTRTHRCLAFAREALTAAAGDVASLMEEENWPTSALLGGKVGSVVGHKHRNRTLSEGSHCQSDKMETGRASSRELKAK